MTNKTLKKRLNTDLLLYGQAMVQALARLNPYYSLKNPIMFVLEITTLCATILLVQSLYLGSSNTGFYAQLVFWLWLTVIFGLFAETLAEGRGKAQANSLRASQKATMAKKLDDAAAQNFQRIPASQLKINDLVLVEAGDFIPGDGEVIEGIASVDESAITGESAPVIRESGGDRSAVTGGTRVLSDHIRIRITQDAGNSFLDRMIKLVEGSKRQKTPNEIALNVLLSGMTLFLLFTTASIPAFTHYAGSDSSLMMLLALFVLLIPTTIGGLLSAIGISGMDRLIRLNVLATSGRAVEAAGDVNTLLLDKTGTITLGNRLAHEFIALSTSSLQDLAEAAQLASLSDETPEGRSIVVLAKEKYGLRGQNLLKQQPVFIPFKAQTRMSGVDIDGHQVRKGAVDVIIDFVKQKNQTSSFQTPTELIKITEKIAKQGGTPLVVAKDDIFLGVIHLKDTIKGGIRERFSELRRMGIRTIMITGDNPLTAAAIAAEAGVDDFLAQATPETKLKLIRSEQSKGKLVAMCGDGTNDAPALAQADVGVAMQTGTQAAREAGNMIDLDSNPTKLIEIVRIGKELLMTRGALTTFSITNDVAKYFVIIPALFSDIYPGLEVLNIMHLASPESAMLSAIVFNALIVIALLPLALRGVRYLNQDASSILRRNILIYGLGGIIVPFIGIKIIDLMINFLKLV
ncbi:MAG: potassium-transporting ATPase subunit KdpB [Alphaproteobacteria bacterium]|nr:potassium-transporting ATPase subunit KdpB [Alphaproteobacteria bacterium]